MNSISRKRRRLTYGGYNPRRFRYRPNPQVQNIIQRGLHFLLQDPASSKAWFVWANDFGRIGMVPQEFRCVRIGNHLSKSRNAIVPSTVSIQKSKRKSVQPTISQREEITQEQINEPKKEVISSKESDVRHEVVYDRVSKLTNEILKRDEKLDRIENEKRSLMQLIEQQKQEIENNKKHSLSSNFDLEKLKQLEEENKTFKEIIKQHLETVKLKDKINHQLKKDNAALKQQLAAKVEAMKSLTSSLSSISEQKEKIVITSSEIASCLEKFSKLYVKLKALQNALQQEIYEMEECKKKKQFNELVKRCEHGLRTFAMIIDMLTLIRKKMSRIHSKTINIWQIDTKNEETDEDFSGFKQYIEHERKELYEKIRELSLKNDELAAAIQEGKRRRALEKHLYIPSKY